jgi:hypothetical protein
MVTSVVGRDPRLVVGEASRPVTFIFRLLLFISVFREDTDAPDVGDRCETRIQWWS